jgi:hypothetical protein
LISSSVIWDRPQSSYNPLVFFPLKAHF